MADLWIIPCPQEGWLVVDPASPWAMRKLPAAAQVAECHVTLDLHRRSLDATSRFELVTIGADQTPLLLGSLLGTLRLHLPSRTLSQAFREPSVFEPSQACLSARYCY